MKETMKENELDGIKVLLKDLHKHEDELLAVEKKYMLAFAQLSEIGKDEQRAIYMEYLRKIERIKKDRNGYETGKGPSEDLCLKIRAAFEANDIETLEEIEKELLL